MATAAVTHPGLRLSTRGIVARALVASVIAAGVFLVPLSLSSTQGNIASRAATFAVIGLSLNILMGHLGQISLGHQAFVGVGAFTSGYVVSEVSQSFWLALPIAAATGAVAAALLGVVALRLGGLYLALLTLAYGLVAEESIFGIRLLTRGGAGMPAPRPAGFQGEVGYLYLCMLVLGVVLLLDWRLVKSKAGRAIAAIRHDERVAATMGVNVVFYKIFAFVLSGFVAGIAGSLFAHREEVVVRELFDLPLALLWVFMTVVGGLRSRAGVVIGSAFFAVFPFAFRPLFVRLFDLFMTKPEATDLAARLAGAVPLFGAALLVLTLVLYPGGIGQQLLPLRRWLAGGSFLEHKPKGGEPGEAGSEVLGPETSELAAPVGSPPSPADTTEEKHRPAARAAPASKRKKD